jgi:probable phosphoglycerate mutase
VSLALIGDTPVGMVELDLMAGEPDKAGVIEFFYMIPEHRRMGIAVQLLGQAVSVFRGVGRARLRMTVSEKNEQALRFCEEIRLYSHGRIRKPAGKTLYSGDGHRLH